jgi:hypothetical protein
MLILKPRGRGNWKPLVLAISGAHLPIMAVRLGEHITLGGIVFRVHQVLP